MNFPPEQNVLGDSLRVSKTTIIPKLLQGLSLARSGIYFLESLPLAFLNRWITHTPPPPPSSTQLALVWKEVAELHDREARNLAQRVYPITALEIENPLRHARSYAEVLADGLRVAWRMRNNKTKDFSRKSKKLKEGLPEYYTRNFHFQTDGYLSEASARRYDHQVEILFTGAAGAMRRLILPPLQRYSHGKGHWLEIACGVGSATRPVLETFPKARVTAMDMSAPYLKIAQENLRPYNNVDFFLGDAGHLAFRDGTFDVVYSVYLFHELPRKEREQVVREAYRVLKPGGLLVFADSLQTDDHPDLNWALERFPLIYHEPFYKDYLGDTLESLLARTTDAQVESNHAFFTKVIWGKKPPVQTSDA